MNREPGGLQSMGSQESDTTKRLNYNHIRKPSQESRQRSCRPQSFPGAVIAPPPALAGPSVSRTTNLLSLEVSCIFSVLHKGSHTKLLFCGGGSCYSQKNYFKIYPCSHMHQKYILSQQWDGWMASLTQWTWVWASSGRWLKTGKPGVLQRIGHDWATKQRQRIPPYGYTTICSCCWVATVMSDSVGPHGWQPNRLLCPWDSAGKNTGVCCHFLLQHHNLVIHSSLDRHFNCFKVWSCLSLAPVRLAVL